MGEFTVDSVYTAVLVVLAVCGAIVTVGKAIDTIKGWRKPKQDVDSSICDTLVNHGQRLDRDKRRLDKHDDDLDDIKEGLRIQCIAIKALLEHALHNGNAGEMKDASDGIDKWLINRR